MTTDDHQTTLYTSYSRTLNIIYANPVNFFVDLSSPLLKVIFSSLQLQPLLTQLPFAVLHLSHIPRSYPCPNTIPSFWLFKIAFQGSITLAQLLVFSDTMKLLLLMSSTQLPVGTLLSLNGVQAPIIVLYYVLTSTRVSLILSQFL